MTLKLVCNQKNSSGGSFRPETWVKGATQIPREVYSQLIKFLLQRTFPIEELLQLHTQQAVEMYGCVNSKITREFTHCIPRL